MTVEKTDTRGDGIVAGNYTFIVASEPIKGEFKPGKTYYEFDLDVIVGAEKMKHQQKIPIWLCQPILRAIGAQETDPGIFEWDTEAVIGTMFDGEIFYEKNINTGKEYRKMRMPVAIAGFPKDSAYAAPKGEAEVPF